MRAPGRVGAWDPGVLGVSEHPEPWVLVIRGFLGHLDTPMPGSVGPWRCVGTRTRGSLGSVGPGKCLGTQRHGSVGSMGSWDIWTPRCLDQWVLGDVWAPGQVGPWNLCVLGDVWAPRHMGPWDPWVLGDI